MTARERQKETDHFAKLCDDLNKSLEYKKFLIVLLERSIAQDNVDLTKALGEWRKNNNLKKGR